MSPVLSPDEEDRQLQDLWTAAALQRDIKPERSSFVPGHGLEKLIVMQKPGETEELWENEPEELTPTPTPTP